MVTIREFFIRSFDITKTNLFWSFDIDNIQKTDDIQAFEIYVLKAENQSGPFITIVGPLINTFSFQDTTNIIDNKNKKIYYKLKIIDKRTNEEIESELCSQSPGPDLIALEITRQEDLLFRTFIGRKCWIFQLKSYGKCVCYDRVTNRQTISNCRSCKGTGFFGGYSSPIEQYIQIDSVEETLQPNQNFNNQPKVTSANLINYPLLHPGDIIVENENKRWIVISVKRSERLRSPLRQICIIKQCYDSDIVYTLPVKVDIKDKDVSDKKNFTNPMTDNPLSI
jgi:hypothetical protein